MTLLQQIFLLQQSQLLVLSIYFEINLILRKKIVAHMHNDLFNLVTFLFNHTTPSLIMVLTLVFIRKKYQCVKLLTQKEIVFLRSWKSAGFNKMGSQLVSLTSDVWVKLTQVKLKRKHRCHKDNRPWTHQENIYLFCHNHLFDDVG